MRSTFSKLASDLTWVLRGEPVHVATFRTTFLPESLLVSFGAIRGFSDPLVSWPRLYIAPPSSPRSRADVGSLSSDTVPFELLYRGSVLHLFLCKNFLMTTDSNRSCFDESISFRIVIREGVCVYVMGCRPCVGRLTIYILLEFLRRIQLIEVI